MNSPISKVNFKLLHMFVAVAEHRSFRQASEMLNRSHSAVSMQIRQLEDQLGVPLFHRTTRRVQLTREGEQLLIHAQRALAEWDNGLRHIREAADLQRGTLAIACVPTLAASRLPEALAVYQDDYPGISIHLRELAAEELFDSVRRQEVDFAIGPGIDKHSEFAFDPICTDPIYALASVAFPLGRRKAIDLSALCQFPILLNSRSSALRALLDRELAVRNLNFQVRFEVVHTNTLLAFAHHRLGVAILPQVAIPINLDPAMRALPITNPSLVRTISIVTLRGQSLSPAAQRLKDVLMLMFRDGLERTEKLNNK